MKKAKIMAAAALWLLLPFHIMADEVASSEEMAALVQIVEEDMIPIYAESLIDGTYEIEVLSSSSMFKIAECMLTVEDGKMYAQLTIKSSSYMKLFAGTGEEAAAASEDECIFYEESEEGWQLYEFPVEALDMGLDCAAYSRRREKWYDRTLVFSASSLSLEAFSDEMILTVEELGLEDGVYSIEAELEGGSGKTKIISPLMMTVKEQCATAVVTIESPHYSCVIVEGEVYEKLEEGSTSSFEIPVTGFDFKMPFTANSTALGTSHEIAYTLFFDSETIQDAEEK